MENVSIDCERPMGKKVEKAREKERKCNERQNIVINEALNQMKDDRRTSMMERRESQLKYENERSELLLLKKRKLELEIKTERQRSDLVALKKRKANMEIMNLDIDSMNGLQQEKNQLKKRNKETLVDVPPKSSKKRTNLVSSLLYPTYQH